MNETLLNRVTASNPGLTRIAERTAAADKRWCTKKMRLAQDAATVALAERQGKENAPPPAAGGRGTRRRARRRLCFGVGI